MHGVDADYEHRLQLAIMPLLSLPPELLRSIIDLATRPTYYEELQDECPNGRILWPKPDRSTSLTLALSCRGLSAYGLETAARHLYDPMPASLRRVVSLDIGWALRALRVDWTVERHSDLVTLLKQAMCLEYFGLTIIGSDAKATAPDRQSEVSRAIADLPHLGDVQLDFTHTSEHFEEKQCIHMIQCLASESVCSLRILHMHEFAARQLTFAELSQLESLTILDILHDPIDVLAGLERAPSSLKHLQLLGLPAGDYLLSALVPEACRGQLESLTLDTAHDYGMLFTIGDICDHGNLQRLDLGTILLSAINTHELPPTLVELACRVELSTSLYDFCDMQPLPYLSRIDLCGSAEYRTPDIERMLRAQDIEVSWTDLME